MKDEKRKEIKDAATRETLVEIFNGLDDSKESLISKARELASDIQNENVYYVKKELSELYSKIQLLNYEIANLVGFIYGEGAVSNAYGRLVSQEYTELTSCIQIIEKTTIFDKESEKTR